MSTTLTNVNTGKTKSCVIHIAVRIFFIENHKYFFQYVQVVTLNVKRAVCNAQF
jgi:hypothetical protein